MKYRLEYTARARKDLQKLDRNTAQRVIRALHGLTEDPYAQVKKAEGHTLRTPGVFLSHRAPVPGNPVGP